MNFKKRNYIKVNGSLYNVDNWSRMYVERRTPKGEKESSIYLCIELPGSERILLLNWEDIRDSKWYMQLGVSFEDIEAMFLEAEVKD